MTNSVLILAGVLSILLGLIHSFLGERMIFMPLRTDKGGTPLHKYRGILWATWHLVTLFGACLGLYLIQLAGVDIPGRLTIYIGCVMLVGTILVIVGTKGKHPGWIILLAIAVLTWIAG